MAAASLGSGSNIVKKIKPFDGPPETN